MQGLFLIESFIFLCDDFGVMHSLYGPSQIGADPNNFNLCDKFLF